MGMTVRGRVAGSVLAVVLVVPGVASCGSAKASLDCGKSALRIAGDMQDVTDRASNVGNLVDKSRREQTSAAVAKLQQDAGDLARNSKNVDQRKAAGDLEKAAANVRTSVDRGGAPDLGPLADAAGEWTKACGS